MPRCSVTYEKFEKKIKILKIKFENGEEIM